MSPRNNLSLVLENIAKILYYLPYYIYLLFRTMSFSLLTIFTRKPADFNGKTILITGASSGIGKQVACSLSRKFPKAKYILWGTNEVNLKKTAYYCKEVGATNVFIYKVDVSKRQQVIEAAAKVRKDVGTVSVLLCNAGITQRALFMNADPVLEEKIITVNLLSYMWTVREFLGDMISAGKGHLAFTNSVTAFCGYPNFTSYVASKTGLRGFVEVLKLELLMHPAKPDITVTEIFPGLVETPILDGVLEWKCRYQFDGLKPIGVKIAADRIVDGILKGKETVVIPKWFTLVDIFSRILPTKFVAAVISHAFEEVDGGAVTKDS